MTSIALFLRGVDLEFSLWQRLIRIRIRSIFADMLKYIEIRRCRVLTFPVHLLVLVFSIGLVQPSLGASFALPLGHEESIMGNTGFAVHGSSASALYNPAMLGTVETPSISASGSSYFILKSEVEGQSDVNLISLNSVPHTLISSWKFGPGTLAAGVIVPESITLELQGDIPVDATTYSGEGANSISTSGVSSRTLAGLSWGQRLFGCGDQCGVYAGASLFLSYAAVKRTGFSYFHSTTPESGQMTATRASASTTSLLPVLGTALELNPQWTLGMRLQLPSIYLKKDSSGKSYQQFTGQNAGTPVFASAEQDEGGLSPDLPMWEGGVGVTYRPNGRVRFSFDVSVGERARAVDGPTAAKAPVDISGGTKINLTERVALLAGTKFDLMDVFTKKGDDEYRAIGWLATMGCSWATDHLETLVGAFNISPIVLSRPQAASNTIVLNAGKTEFWGLLLSSVYRF